MAAVFIGHDSPAGAGHTPRAWDWSDALEWPPAVGDVLGVELVVEPGAAPGLPPRPHGQDLAAQRRGVGYSGELHPKLLAARDLPARTVALELNADAALRGGRRTSSWPSTLDVPAGHPGRGAGGGPGDPGQLVLETLREGAGELLEEIALFDVYSGTGIESGKKSLAFGLRFRANDRTLTADEASEARAAAVALAAERFGAVQR